jgi:ABC-type antimicrobial peptide transport system ATPase subunit
MTQFEYSYISDYFSGDIEFNQKYIKIFNFDIETTFNHGMEVSELLNNPIEDITAITYTTDGKIYYTLSCKDYDVHKSTLKI